MKVEKHDLIRNLIEEKVYSQIQFFNSYHEFHTVQGLIKAMDTCEKGDFMELASGERIFISGIVSLNGRFMPGYEHFEDFTCDC